MRCIEMLAPIVVNEYIRGLTLTWDVLKWERHELQYTSTYRLTLTWDVLKSAQASNVLASVYRLTLTWDVLKYGI